MESPISIAVYHGNMEMVNMLQQWGIIRSHHFPQAFREAAIAGDIEMLIRLWDICGKNTAHLTEAITSCKTMSSPLHVAAAAGHMRCVQFLCQNETLRTLPDAIGDLPLSYAIDNNHLAIVDFLMKTFPNEISNNAIRSTIACKHNKLAKYLLTYAINSEDFIRNVEPVKFSVGVGNFHIAEYVLKQYMCRNKVNTPPWSVDVYEALSEVLVCKLLDPIKKTRFVIAFQLAGVKVSMVNVVKLVNDKFVAATICNSLKHNFNQPRKLL
ncbi:ankyrin repeat protein [Dictyocaulus viviparus]|uniref:Ankyrin repeat protein n=1 Tax=Dictyocaulus viviparus TaxID=29172 RepID=A0A0D8XTX4_DICVI|nr:ankyrin repeat protein [Dictyocaulus viviparus]